MATIESKIDRERDLTIHEVTGTLTVPELVQVVQSQNANDPTRLVVWNLCKADTSAIPTEAIQAGAMALKHITRPGGKTAMVAERDIDFGIAQMTSSYSEAHGLQVPIRAFRTMEVALAWLESDDA